MAITSQLEIARKKTLKSLFPVNIETGAVGSGEGAWLLSVPRSSVHWVRVGQGLAVLAVDVEGSLFAQFSLLYRFDVSISLQETARQRLKYCLKGPLNPKQHPL